MPDIPISRATGGAGNNWDKDAHLGHLHLIVANEGFRSESTETKFGTSLAVKVDFVVCVD